MTANDFSNKVFCMLSVVLFSWLQVVFHSLGYWLMLVHFSNVFYGLIVVSFGVV